MNVLNKLHVNTSNNAEANAWTIYGLAVQSLDYLIPTFGLSRSELWIIRK